jgi:hypothetical protein
MRTIDDVVDEDVSTPYGLNVEQYVKRKNHTVYSMLAGAIRGVDEEDVLLIHVLRESRVPIRQWLRDIWEVFVFDYAKRSHKQPVSRETLIEMASKQDLAINSILLSLAVHPVQEADRFRRLQTKLESFKGFMTRQDWLVDLFEDLAEGSINVPYAVLLENGVEVANLLACRNRNELSALPGLEEWYLWELAEMQEYWGKAEEFLPEFLSVFDNKLIRYVIRTLFREWKKKFDLIREENSNV